MIRPQLILLAGASALKGVLGVQTGITKVRGQWLDTAFYGAKAMPVFHPSYLLRNQSKEVGSPKWLMWQDIKEVRRALDAYTRLNDCNFSVCLACTGADWGI